MPRLRSMGHVRWYLLPLAGMWTYAKHQKLLPFWNSVLSVLTAEMVWLSYTEEYFHLHTIVLIHRKQRGHHLPIIYFVQQITLFVMF